MILCMSKFSFSIFVTFLLAAGVGDATLASETVQALIEKVIKGWEDVKTSDRVREMP